jgi:hypothetical protein
MPPCIFKEGMDLYLSATRTSNMREGNKIPYIPSFMYGQFYTPSTQPRDRVPVANLAEGWVDLRASMGVVMKINVSKH